MLPDTPRLPAGDTSKCPFCGSPSLATNAKAENHDTYTRCNRCGEIWNTHRLNERQQSRRW